MCLVLKLKLLEKMEKEEIEDYIHKLKAQVDELNIVNTKLAYAVRLFCYCHYTEEEKLMLAQLLDNCSSEKQIVSVYEKLVGEIKASSKPNSKMSPEFSRGLIGMYKESNGFNPFEDFSNLYSPISTYIKIVAELKIAEPGSKRDAMEKHMKELEEKIFESNSTILHLLANV